MQRDRHLFLAMVGTMTGDDIVGSCKRCVVG